MQTFVINSYTNSSLQSQQTLKPHAPRRHEVQLKLLGTSINPIDRLIATGYGAPLLNPRQAFPQRLGRDAVAQIVHTGRSVTDLMHGQRVLVTTSPRTDGTYADYFNLPRRCVTEIPDNLPNTLAAGIGYAGLTALQALAAVGINETTAYDYHLCINGASGGVGSIALILASHWGARITAVASSKNHSWLQELAPCTTVSYQDKAAMSKIRANAVLHCAAQEAYASNTDPLLGALEHGGNYATTVTPILTAITRNGLIRGVASSNILFLKKHFRLRRRGILYRWVMFQENQAQLKTLANFFAANPSLHIVSEQHPLSALPQHFNTPAKTGPGKVVFLRP